MIKEENGVLAVHEKSDQADQGWWQVIQDEKKNGMKHNPTFFLIKQKNKSSLIISLIKGDQADEAKWSLIETEKNMISHFLASITKENSSV